MLIDSGAEVSAISTRYEEDIINKGGILPTLPLSGLSIHNAVGNKATKVSKQVWIPVKIGTEVIHVAFIVIPDLNEGGIIGNDFLETYMAKLDFEDRRMCIKTKNKTTYIQFISKEEGTPAHLRTIQTRYIKEAAYSKQVRMLPEHEQEFLDEIIELYPEVFREEPGRIIGYECQIRLKDNKPICVKPYPIPIAKQGAVETEIKRMLDMGIIKRSNSPFSIPIVPVFKKNGEVRLCLDARKINCQIITDCERPMTMETILAKFKSVRCISTLDLRSGYWQIPLSEDSKPPCSFLINGRNYSYQRLPFGLNISGAEFQKCMDRVLGSLIHEFVTIYVDDILITSDSIQQHREHIKKVLDRFKEYNVTVNLEKCQFFRKEVSFLGHIISTNGIKMDEEKIKTIQEFKEPENKKQMQSFLGFVNFYRRYVEKFAHITAPLLELVKKDKKWKWETRHKVAFEKVKETFLKEVIIAFPNFEQPLYINTDASNAAIGGELFQILNETRATLGYASRTLKPAETRYTTTELEALALIYCCTKFRQYLIGHKVIIQTDHQALTFIKQCRLTNGRLTRWALALQEFDFEIVHIPGKENIVADTLTRYPRMGESRTEPRVYINKVNLGKYSKDLQNKIRTIARLQEMDRRIAKMKEKESEHITTINKTTFVRRSEKNHWQLIIPDALISQLVKETHETTGHPGKRKTYLILSEACTFKNMNRSIAEIIKNCDACQRNKPLNYSNKGKMTSHKPTKVLEKVSIDLMGPLPMGRGGTQYILAILDTFSKFIKLYALKKATTRAILNRIETNYIPTVGKPDCILTDNGTQFASKKWKEKLNELEIKTCYATKYHPQSNPVERYNRETGRLLRTYCHNQHSKWPNLLEQVEFWLNRTQSEVTGITPVQAMTGRRPKNSIEDLIQFPPQPPDISKDEITCRIAERIKSKAERKEEKVNKGRKNVQFTVGQQVLIKNHYMSSAEKTVIKKLFNLFEGPFIVKKIIGNSTLVIVNENTQKEEIINITEVRPYFREASS